MTILPLLRSGGRVTVETVTYTSYATGQRLANVEAVRLPPDIANDMIGDISPLNLHADDTAVWAIEANSIPNFIPRADDFVVRQDGTTYTAVKIQGPLRIRKTDFYAIVTRSTP